MAQSATKSGRIPLCSGRFAVRTIANPVAPIHRNCFNSFLCGLSLLAALLDLVLRNLYTTFMFLILGFFFLGVAAGAEPLPISFLAQADAAYAKRSDLPQGKIALFYYEKTIATEPSNTEAYWKASRAAWWVGENASSGNDKLTYFRKGMAWAQEAVAHNPNSVQAHFWLGANYGSYGETKGVLKSLSLVKPIRHEMAEVLRLDDHYLGGGGYRVLGVVDYKVPGIVGGSKKRAAKELHKALALDPHDPFTHYYLAEFYELTGEKEKAKAEIKLLQSLDVPTESLPELDMMKKKGERLWAKLEG